MSKTYIPTSLRRMIFDQADRCCEYCLQPEIFAFCLHEIDHVIAEKHEGLTIAENLALACKLCNTFKGSDIAWIDPLTREITALYNPRTDIWREHFRLEEAMFLPLTAKARTTVRLLQLNRSDRVAERKIWIPLGFLREVE